MNATLIRLLSCLSRATLDPALGGRGMALSRLLSLAAFGAAKGDEDALKSVSDIITKIEAALNIPRNLTHEEWNDLQASAESGHWFLRAEFPQVSATGTIVGGHKVPEPTAPEPIDDTSSDEEVAPPRVKPTNAAAAATTEF